MMTPDEYQKLAARTLIDAPERPLTDGEIMIVWNAIGLAGETGEVVDNIKKAIFHRHGLNQTQLMKELGDVCWYLAGLCTKLGFSLEDVMQQNIDKLIERYPNGYSSDASKNRK